MCLRASNGAIRLLRFSQPSPFLRGIHVTAAADDEASGDKTLLLLESGIRFHTTKFQRDKVLCERYTRLVTELPSPMLYISDDASAMQTAMRSSTCCSHILPLDAA